MICLARFCQQSMTKIKYSTTTQLYSSTKKLLTTRVERQPRIPWATPVDPPIISSASHCGVSSVIKSTLAAGGGLFGRSSIRLSELHKDSQQKARQKNEPTTSRLTSASSRRFIDRLLSHGTPRRTGSRIAQLIILPRRVGRQPSDVLKGIENPLL